jgi:TRAP-type C4-dicarboxylate transport system permease small subunit
MFVSSLRWLCQKIDLIVKLAGYAASGLMPILAFIVSFEVFSRYFLNRPTIWAFDLSLFLFGYIAILGGAYAQQKRAHITVDILYKKVSPKARRIFDLISYSLAIFFLILIFYLCFEKLQDAIKFGTRRQSEWAPLMSHYWIMVIFACTLFILQLGRDMIDNVFYLVTGNNLVAEEKLEISYTKAEKEDGN